MKLPALTEHFVTPLFLAVAIGCAVAAALALTVLARRAAKRRQKLVSPALASRGLLPPTPAPGVALALVLVAVLGTGAALARPRWGAKTEHAERRGSDIAILIDTSSSMRATDVSPNRFVLARQAAASLLERLAGDRVALVAFEGEAQVLVPLTLDTAAAGLFLDALEPGIGSKPGSSMAAGLAAAVELFPPGAVAGKTCVLISDGEDLEGGVDDAIKKAKEEGIVVHTVIAGAPEGKGAPVPDVDVSGRVTGYKSYEGSPVLSKADPDALRKLAGATGGTFSVVSTGRTDLAGVAAAIDRAARRPLEGTMVTSQEERFQVPLGIGVAATTLLLLGAGSLSFRRKARAAAVAALLCAFALEGQAQPSQGKVQMVPFGPTPAAPQAGAPGASQAAPGTAGPGAAVDIAPEPTPSTVWGRINSRPPFTTARGEAKKGQKAIESKELGQAVNHFARQTELAPKDLTGAYNLGTALSRAGKSAEAMAAFDAVRKAGPRSLAADASYNAGESLFRENKFAEAGAAFRECLKRAPGDPDAAWNYEVCQRRQAEQEQKQKQSQNQKDSKDQKEQKQQPQPGASPTPSPNQQAEDEKKQKEKQDQEFRDKAKMSREKAEQILSAIAQADREEQRKKIAEQRAKRRVARDW